MRLSCQLGLNPNVLERCDSKCASIALQFLESPIYFSLLFMAIIVATTDGNLESLEDGSSIFLCWILLAVLIVDSGAIRMWHQRDFVSPVVAWQTDFSLKRVSGALGSSGLHVYRLL